MNALWGVGYDANGRGDHRRVIAARIIRKKSAAAPRRTTDAPRRHSGRFVSYREPHPEAAASRNRPIRSRSIVKSWRGTATSASPLHRPGRPAALQVPGDALQLHAADHRQRHRGRQRHLGEPGGGVLRSQPGVEM